MILDPEEHPTLTVEEAAPILGLSRGGTYDLIQRGELPVIRLGKMIRIPTAALRLHLGMDDRSPDGALIAENATLRAEVDRLRLVIEVIRTAIGTGV